MRILVLVAGTNDPSNCDALADAFIEGLSKIPGTEINKVHVRDLHLDHFSLDHYREGAPEEEDFRKIRSLVLDTGGIVVATPIWNFSVPAHLKNLIDRMGSFGLDRETRSDGQLGGKPCYFLFTGGAPVPAWKGLQRFTTSHLGESFRYFGGTIVGKYYEGKTMQGRGKFGLVVDQRPKSLERVRARGEKFGLFVQRFVVTKKLPLYYRLFTKAYRLGQRILAKLF